MTTLVCFSQIISDFDDTLVCSGAKPKFAGCDDRLPRKAIYPGVLTLWKEIDAYFADQLSKSLAGDANNGKTKVIPVDLAVGAAFLTSLNPWVLNCVHMFIIAVL